MGGSERIELTGHHLRIVLLCPDGQGVLDLFDIHGSSRSSEISVVVGMS